MVTKRSGLRVERALITALCKIQALLDRWRAVEECQSVRCVVRATHGAFGRLRAGTLIPNLCTLKHDTFNIKFRGVPLFCGTHDRSILLGSTACQIQPPKPL